MGRPKKGAPPEEIAGAPQWMVTFSDCMNLLLTFFVLLVTFSEFSQQPEDRILNFGKAIRSVFGTPIAESKRQDETSVVSRPRVVNMEQPEYGSEAPTGVQSPTATNGTLNEDLQTTNYRNHKVFLIPSRKVFLGRGRALSPDGRYFLAVMAAFLKDTLGGVVISENGPDDQTVGVDAGLSRAMAVLDYLVTMQSLDRRKFSVASESIAPPEDKPGATTVYHRDERMLEIVLLEANVQ